MRSIRKIVVLGANGTMGAGAGALFALAGIPTTLLARTVEKAEAGRARAEQLGKGKIAPGTLATGAYDADLARTVADADLIFEAVAEQLDTKRQVFALIDRVRAPHAIVASVTSGLSIAELCASCSEEMRRQFLGVHLFNPPTVITGCELIGNPETTPEVMATVRTFLERTLGRVVVECADLPAFAGNRIGFKVLNEVAQLAAEHGVAYMDQLVGSHTGRALPPLATIDLVGWDVHAAIVGHLWRATDDEAHPSFELPAYMARGIAAGTLGRKTRDKGGFFRVEGKGDNAVHFALDPATGTYHPLAERMPPLPAFVERMKAAIRTGRHTDALDAMCDAEGDAAAILRQVILGYISYALGRVGEVVEQARDVDRIMGFGFNWAPPSLLVDSIGPARTIALLEAAQLPVPPVIERAAHSGELLCADPALDSRKFFIAA